MPASNVPPGQQDGTAPAVEEIVVTAQRRSERLQEVPGTVTALTANTAEALGVSGTEALTIATPGLDFSRFSGFGGTPFIRGVGTSQAVTGIESSVATYVDDVYLGTPIANVFAFNNIERVEVIKGPQGTLFGRNATGGVISVTTRRPSQKAAFDAQVGYGNYDTYSGSAYANMPLSSTFAVNAAFDLSDQSRGYGIDLKSGQDIYKHREWSVRSEASWQPGSGTSFLLIGDYFKSRGDDGLNQATAPRTVGRDGSTFRGRFTATNLPGDRAIVESGGVSLRADQDLGFAKLASISAYRFSNLDVSLDQTGGGIGFVTVDVIAPVRSFSQEIQLLSPSSSPLRWIVGAYYYNSDSRLDPVTQSGLALGPAISKKIYSAQRLNSWSGFGELRYELLPSTEVTVGLRYTRDFYDFDTRTVLGTGAVPAANTFSQSDSFGKLTYRAVIDHKFTNDIHAYVSYSRGFKSGGYNLSAPGNAPGAPPVSPEVLDAVEIGVKSEVFDHRLRFNLSAYHYDYKDLQVTVIGPATSVIINAAKARINGIDMDFSAALSGRLTITGGAAFIWGKYTDFPNGPLNVPNPAVCTPTPQTTGAPTGGNTQCAVDLAGNRTVRSPKFSGSVGITYKVPTAIGDLGIAGSLSHNSGFYWDPDNRLTQPSYTLLNTNLSWTSSDERFEARVWVKNLTNAYYYQGAVEGALRDSVRPATPRTYGVTLGVHF
ncbi:TonB-dependent receptor [Sphingomonas oligophenolica]|uniref:TonB-dependent receptor n=1 Tax=Sphingomonas oligophenolica TaxID=301154 RepID=UPI0031D45DE0